MLRCRCAPPTGAPAPVAGCPPDCPPLRTPKPSLLRSLTTPLHIETLPQSERGDHKPRSGPQDVALVQSSGRWSGHAGKQDCRGWQQSECNRFTVCISRFSPAECIWAFGDVTGLEKRSLPNEDSDCQKEPSCGGPLSCPPAESLASCCKSTKPFYTVLKQGSCADSINSMLCSSSALWAE